MFHSSWTTLFHAASAAALALTPHVSTPFVIHRCELTLDASQGLLQGTDTEDNVHIWHDYLVADKEGYVTAECGFMSDANNGVVTGSYNTGNGTMLFRAELVQRISN